MNVITDKQGIQQVQSELLPRLVDQWALLTSGDKDDWNTMTIAWGSLGDIWWKPVVDAYVVPTRYTYEFMERHEIFTVSFFPPEFHDDLTILGSKSGRDGDKVALTKLTPMQLEQGGMSFEQADTILVCRKMYKQPLDPNAIPKEVMSSFYESMPPHTHFIGEIIAAIKK
ncbi:MAG: flavin reductase family protein [Coriobacteriales bacterium]|jgi:flavin reductase (DIM6/NTAB) family NADH-FMN oxidoreductase RutF